MMSKGILKNGRQVNFYLLPEDWERMQFLKQKTGLFTSELFRYLLQSEFYSRQDSYEKYLDFLKMDHSQEEIETK